jgi:hypothetical protein
MRCKAYLEQDDQEELGKYLCNNWTFNRDGSAAELKEAILKAIADYLNDRPVRWKNTPSWEAEDIMRGIFTSVDAVNIFGRWDEDDLILIGYDDEF